MIGLALSEGGVEIAPVGSYARSLTFGTIKMEVSGFNGGHGGIDNILLEGNFTFLVITRT
jgi:hypothetical protein